MLACMVFSYTITRREFIGIIFHGATFQFFSVPGPTGISFFAPPNGSSICGLDTLNTVGFQSLPVHINETIVLPLTTFTFSVVGQPSPSKVQRVNKAERQRTSATTGGDVGGEFLPCRGSFWCSEDGFDLIFESKVESLGWKVPQNVGKVSSPEWYDTLGFQGSHRTIDDAFVRLGETSLFDHLVLVLDE